MLKTKLIYISAGLLAGLLIGWSVTNGYYMKREMDCWEQAYSGPDILKKTKAEIGIAFATCYQPKLRLDK